MVVGEDECTYIGLSIIILLYPSLDFSRRVERSEMRERRRYSRNAGSETTLNDDTTENPSIDNRLRIIF